MKHPLPGGDRPLAGALAFLAASLGLHPVVTPDFWWHLASGRWVLEHGRAPRTDPFTYTSATHEWINLQWLGDALLALAYRGVGAEGLVLLKAATLGATAWLLFRAIRSMGASVAAGGVAVGLALLASAERTLMRPEIISYLLLAITLLLVEIGGRGRRWAWMALVGLTAVWVNLHSLAFLAPVVIALRSVAGRFAGDFEPRAARAGLATAVVAAVALLINPYGWAAWTFPLTLFERIDADADVFSRILEFASPLQAPGDTTLRFFWLLLGVSAVSAAWARTRRVAAGVLLAAPFLVLALLARRNVPLFAILVTPLLASSLTELARRRPWRRPAAAVAISATLLGALILAGASPSLLGLHRERGVGVQPGLFPHECLDALARTGSTRLFNDMDLGGFVTWSHPGRRTFIDGRLEVVGANVLRSYVEAHESPVAWARIRDSWKWDALLLQHSSSGSAALLRWLVESGDWTLACESPAAVLLLPAAGSDPVPRIPARTAADWNARLAESRGPEPGGGRALSALARPITRWITPSPSPAAVRSAVRLANLSLTLGRLDDARAGLDAVLAQVPADPEALFNRGMCDLRQGRPDEARRRWRNALDQVPRRERARFEEALERVPAEGPSR